MLKKPSIWSLLVFAILILQVGWYFSLWSFLLSGPALTRIDFVSFYTAGRIAQSGELQQLYNLDLQQSIQRDILGPDVGDDMLPYLHPPFLVPLLMPFISESYRQSFLWWSLILWLVTGLASFVVFRFLVSQGWKSNTSVLVAISSFLFYPVFMTVLKGQDTTFLLLGILLWIWAFSQRQDKLAGIGLALTTIKPQIALMLALPFIFARRQVWWGFCASAGLLSLVSYLLVGMNGVSDYIDLIFITAQGKGYGINQSVQFNFTGLMLRLMPDINPSIVQIMNWLLFLCSILFLCWLWRSKKNKLTINQLGLATILSLFASPHLHFHDLSLLILPGLALLIMTVNHQFFREQSAAILLASSSLLLIISDLLSGMWRYLAAYMLMAIFFLALLALSRLEENQHKPPQPAIAKTSLP